LLSLEVADRHETEEVLAAARFVAALVFTSLLGRYAFPLGAFGAVLVTYLLYAGVLYGAVRRRASLGRSTQLAVHAVDLMVPIAVAFAGLQGGDVARIWYAASALYLVPLVHAAVRWGPTMTVATMVLAIVAALARTGTSPAAAFVPFDAVACLLIAGSLLTFIALLEQRRAAHRALLTRLREDCEAARGFKTSLRIALSTLAALFQARQTRIVGHSVETGRSFGWEFSAADGELRSFEPQVQEPERWLASAFAVGQWTGRVEIVEPSTHERRVRAVRFLARAVREIAPTLYRSYIQACTRARAAREERAQLARELHDGPIQSLIGAEMSLAALRRRAEIEGSASWIDGPLSQAQQVLHREILGLRELMVRMKPLDLPPGGLTTYLDQAVRRFAQDSGIRGEFVAEGRSADRLSRQHAVACARIVNEALTNVRKHSGATRVVVSLEVGADAARLVVHDNGRGFDPSRSRETPEMISDVVRSVGGRLRVESSPGRGARLEIAIPPGGRASPLQKVAS